MKRPAVAAVTLVLAGAVLAGCGGQSAYCEAVEKNAETLNTFGKTRSDEAYTSYASTFRSIAEVSPAGVKKQWTGLADVTDGVLKAQDEVGLDLGDMKDADKVKELSEGQLETLNTAYEAFNDTADQRTAVVKNVKTECEITLK